MKLNIVLGLICHFDDGRTRVKEMFHKKNDFFLYLNHDVTLFSAKTGLAALCNSVFPQL